jgi:hypothetical protein
MQIRHVHADACFFLPQVQLCIWLLNHLLWKKNDCNFTHSKISHILIACQNQYQHDSYASMWVRNSGVAVHCRFLKCVEICVWIELRFLS